MRAGGYTLMMLSMPRVALILRSLAGANKSRQDLRRDSGFPAQSTLRNQLQGLEVAGVLMKHRSDASPEALEYVLTASGHELLTVLDSLGIWLGGKPNGGLELDSDPARAAIRALADSWIAGMLPLLSTAPLSLTELDKELSRSSYPSLERRLDSLRLAEQVEEGEGGGSGTPYMATKWLRRGIVPIVQAASWEHGNDHEEAEAVTRLEIGSAFTIAAPMLAFPLRLSGICQLAVRAPVPGKRKRALGTIEIRAGELIFNGVHPQEKPDAWASGKSADWFAALIEGDTGCLRLSGDRDLALAIFAQIHRVLGIDRRAPRYSQSKTD